MALTVPAYIAADLVRRDCPDASMALKSLDYPPVAAVTVSYPMSAIKQDRLDEARKLPGARLCPLSILPPPAQQRKPTGTCKGHLDIHFDRCDMRCDALRSKPSLDMVWPSLGLCSLKKDSYYVTLFPVGGCP